MKETANLPGTWQVVLDPQRGLGSSRKPETVPTECHDSPMSLLLLGAGGWGLGTGGTVGTAPEPSCPWGASAPPLPAALSITTSLGLNPQAPPRPSCSATSHLLGAPPQPPSTA